MAAHVAVHVSRDRDREPLLQVLAVEQLHDDEGRAGRRVLVDVEDLRDVLRLNRSGGAGFPLEANEGRVARLGVGRRDHLERDVPAGARVARLVDDAHATLP